MPAAKPIRTGTRFERLTVIADNGRFAVHCMCDCGAPRVLARDVLRYGNTRSCGCLRRETSRSWGLANLAHGHATPTPSPTYSSWHSMKARCSNPKDRFFHVYGGRGITVCKRWRSSFAAFLADMGERPKGTSLDRINNDGPYSKANCKWSTVKEQARHRANSRFLSFKGETMCVAAWADRLHMSRIMLYQRLNRGWSVERALTEKSHGN